MSHIQNHNHRHDVGDLIMFNMYNTRYTNIQALFLVCPSRRSTYPKTTPEYLIVWCNEKNRIGEIFSGSIVTVRVAIEKV